MKTGMYIGLGVVLLVLAWFGWKWYQDEKKKSWSLPSKIDATLTATKYGKIDTEAMKKEVLSKLNQGK